MTVDIAGCKWKNPVTTASGTFSPVESADLYDYSMLGAVTTKGVSFEPWEGNPTPRIAEASSGMINSVGLENPGVENYLVNDVPFLEKKLNGTECKIITNVAGHTDQEYIKAVMALNRSKAIDILEINISCPNLQSGGMSFGTDPRTAHDLISSIKSVTDKPVIVKLTPNVANIGEIAKSVEEGGADAISLINTLAAMAVDINTGKPILANTSGGLSGPAIKPVALKMVHDASETVNIPIIGMGGISTGKDALEFLLAGAQAVAVGTAGLLEPGAPLRILDELESLMNTYGYTSLADIPKI